MKKLLFIVLAVLLIASPAYAGRLTGFMLDLGYSKISGTEQTRNIYIGIEAGIEVDALEIRFTNETLQARSNNVINELMHKSDLKLRYHFIPAYVFFDSSYYSDISAGINHETDLGTGAGLRYDYVAVETGLYSRSALLETQTLSKTTVDINYPISEIMKLYSESDFEFDTDDKEDYRATTKNYVRFALSDIMSLKIGEQYIYQNRPMEGSLRDHRKTFANISVSF